MWLSPVDRFMFMMQRGMAIARCIAGRDNEVFAWAAQSMPHVTLVTSTRQQTL